MKRTLFVICVLGMLVLGTAFVGSVSAAPPDKGSNISKNSDFSTEDRSFIQTTDAIYMRVWSSQVGDYPDVHTWDITDSQGYSEGGYLTDGYGTSPGGTTRWGTNVLASHFATGDATLHMLLQNGKKKYEVTETISIIGEPEPQWTWIMYLDGDNNVETYAQMELDEMVSVGSKNYVNIVVLFDKLGPGNTQAYYVHEGSLEQIPWDSEVNMGDPNTLSTFAIYAITNYPAENYYLELWDHGLGWHGICWDETSGDDSLTMQDVGTALNDIKIANGNNNIEILEYTACLAGEIENSHEVNGSIDYHIYSEESMSVYGLPHDVILTDLTANPYMSPANLCTTVVTRFGEFYDATPLTDQTLSAVEMSKLPALVTSTDTFAQLLIPKTRNSQDRSKIERSLQNSEYFSSGAPYYNVENADLYDFAKQIEKNFRKDAQLKSAAQDVKNKVSAAVFAEYHGPSHRDAHGMAIYFPKNYYYYAYENLGFAVDTHWGEFLHAFYPSI